MTRVGSATVAVCLMLATTVAAQDITPRAYSGLFGGSGYDPNRTRALDATVSLAAAYDRNSELDEQGPLSVLRQSGTSQLLAGDLSFVSNGRRVQWKASGGSYLRYFNEQQELLRMTDYALVGFSSRLGRRATLAAGQTVACGPLQMRGLVPIESSAGLGDAAPGIDYSVTVQRACLLGTSGSVGFGLGRRLTAELSASADVTTFESGVEYRGLNAHAVGGQLSYALSTNASLRVKYQRRTGAYAAAGEATHVLHDIDAGLDYRRPLSLSRRTYLDFRIGSTALTEPSGREGTVAETVYQLTGEVGLNHEFGRTWRARAGYSRGVNLVEGLVGPVAADMATLSVSGFFSRRLDFDAFGSAAIGDVHSRDPISLHTYTASGRLRYALARAWALHGEYTFYTYDFGPGALAYRVDSSVNRQAARVGLSWWLPIMGR